MDDMVGDLGDPRMGAGAGQACRGSRGLLVILSTWILVVAALALAPLAQAAEESIPEVHPVPGGFTWESQGFAEEWGYVVAISRCSDANSCHPEEFKVEKIPGIQSYVPYRQNITAFTPEVTEGKEEVWVGIAVLPKRQGTHLAYRPTRVKVPLQEVSETHGLEAPRELWAEGAVVNWSGVGEEIPNLDYKVAVSNEPRFCPVKDCRDTHYVDVPAQAGRSYSPCIGHLGLGYLGFASEPITVYVGVAALKFKNQPGNPIYTGSEVAVKPPPCPPPNAETTTPVSSVTQSSALLAGHVDPLGTKGVACYFEYATEVEYQATAKYGHKEECLGWSQGEGPKADDVYMPIGRLAQETTYHFRLFAPGPVQIGNGASPDKTFTTLHPKNPPVELAAPALSGTPIAGYNYNLTVTSGVWAYLPGYAYQWQRCDAAGNSCANVVGATANSLSLSGSDVGHRLRSIVTATNADGSAQAPSGPSPVIGSTVGSRARWAWERPHTSTRVVSMKVAGIPVGGALELTCRGHGCPFHSRKINLTPHQSRCRHRPCKRGSAGPRTQVTLAYPFGHDHFRPGTVLGARVTRAGWAARVSQFTIRGKAEEEPVEVCLVPGAPRAAACPS